MIPKRMKLVPGKKVNRDRVIIRERILDQEDGMIINLKEIIGVKKLVKIKVREEGQKIGAKHETMDQVEERGINPHQVVNEETILKDSNPALLVQVEEE